MPLVNCEINLILTWSENCVLTDIITQAANPNADPAIPAINAPTNATAKIRDTKLYLLVVTLSTEDDNTFLEQLKSGFKRIIKWNKYKSEVTSQRTKTNNLNYLIDPTFNKVNRLFALSFENEDGRFSFWKYYTLKVKTNTSIRIKEEIYEKIIEMSKNNDYTTGNLLDYEYYSKHYKLITIDLTNKLN